MSLCRHFPFIQRDKEALNSLDNIVSTGFVLTPVWSCGGESVSSQQSVKRNRSAWKTGSFQGVPKNWLSIYQLEMSMLPVKSQRHFKGPSVLLTRLMNLREVAEVQDRQRHHHSIFIPQYWKVVYMMLFRKPNIFSTRFVLKPVWSCAGNHVYSQQSVVRDRSAWKTGSSQEVPKHWLSVYQWEKLLLPLKLQRFFKGPPLILTRLMRLLGVAVTQDRAMSPPLHLYSTISSQGRFRTHEHDNPVHKYSLRQMITKSVLVTGIAFASTAMAKDISTDESSIRFSSSSSSTSSTSFNQEKLAKMYGLDMKQWKEYQTVMKGPRGLWSPNIHPIMALGIREGISASEHRKLAKKMATINYERVKRELAFEHAVRAEGMKMYGHIPLYVDDQILSGTKKSYTKDIKYFVQPECNTCKNTIQKWLSQGQKVDIYIAGNKKQISQFARRMGISPLLVPGQITLNATTLAEMAAQGIERHKLPVTRIERRNLQ